MVAKIINATECKVGTNIILEGRPSTIRKIDISKTGKHGHAKARIEAVGMLDGSKKIIVIPGHDRLEVPMVDKRKSQVLSIGDHVSLMDLESFETIDLECSDQELKSQLEEGGNAEYWIIEGVKVIKRKL